MSSSNLVCALRLKSNAVRGGVLQNIFMRNVNVGVVRIRCCRLIFFTRKAQRAISSRSRKSRDGKHHRGAHAARAERAGFPAATIATCGFTIRFSKIQKPDQVIEADVKLVNCALEQAK